MSDSSSIEDFCVNKDLRLDKSLTSAAACLLFGDELAVKSPRLVGDLGLVLWL